MQNTLSIFEDRKQELLVYFSILSDIDNGNIIINNNKSHFIKILKSNYLLMLYNLVEACIVSGIVEIYEGLKNDNCTYDGVIDEIKQLWTNYQITQIYGPTTQKITYQRRVKEIIDNITQHNQILLSRNILKDISGNLDARKIKQLCDKHRIRYCARDDTSALETVKTKRNSLAHGDISFSNCARDLTLTDLDNIKNAVEQFMGDILNGMQTYYNEKQYKLIRA